jgi:Dolichyl-phosphate-mannose-protein mannosyltransferase
MGPGPAKLRSLWALAGPIAVGMAVTAVFLVPMAVWGGVDNDEGYYGLAAKLTTKGDVLYRDFFYTQSPLLPYVYGAWMEVFGFTLAASRALSVIFALVLGALICHHASRRFSSLWIGGIAVVAFAATRLVSTWLSTTKTYALSTLLLFGAFMLVDQGMGARSPRRWLAAGVLLGLAIDVRLIFAATAPVFLVLAWRAGRTRAGHWAAGLGLGLLPSLILLVVVPTQFIFGNIGFHSVRSDSGLVGNLDQKLNVVGDVLGEWQFVALLLLAAAAVSLRLADRRPPPLAFWLAATLGFASLLPTPTYAQYACTTVPFLIFTALGLVPEVRDRLRTRGGARNLRWAVAGAAVLALGFAIEGLRGVDRAHDFDSLNAGVFNEVKPSGVERIADRIDAETAPGEKVLAFRPIYVFLSHTEQVPGFENDEAPVAAQIGGFSEAHAEELRLITNERLETLIRDHGVRVIIGPGDSRPVWGTAGRPWLAIVRQAGYRPLSSVEGVTLWVRPEDAAAS